MGIRGPGVEGIFSNVMCVFVWFILFCERIVVRKKMVSFRKSWIISKWIWKVFCETWEGYDRANSQFSDVFPQIIRLKCCFSTWIFATYRNTITHQTNLCKSLLPHAIFNPNNPCLNHPSSTTPRNVYENTPPRQYRWGSRRPNLRLLQIPPISISANPTNMEKLPCKDLASTDDWISSRHIIYLLSVLLLRGALTAGAIPGRIFVYPRTLDPGSVWSRRGWRDVRGLLNLKKKRRRKGDQGE